MKGNAPNIKKKLITALTLVVITALFLVAVFGKSGEPDITESPSNTSPQIWGYTKFGPFNLDLNFYQYNVAALRDRKYSMTVSGELVEGAGGVELHAEFETPHIFRYLEIGSPLSHKPVYGNNRGYFITDTFVHDTSSNQPVTCNLILDIDAGYLMMIMGDSARNIYVATTDNNAAAVDIYNYFEWYADLILAQ